MSRGFVSKRRAPGRARRVLDGSPPTIEVLAFWHASRFMRTIRESRITVPASRWTSATAPERPRNVVWPHTRYMPAKTRAAVDELAARIPAMLGA